jgi:amino acid adenylation domain-containing protein/non-ribosomal peptide synthase protein (TIGR01720 family)
VEEAIRRRLDKGFGLGPQCDLTAIAAERIGALTGMERVCFCNTGSESVMFALRLARAKSGKKRAALFSGAYHGIFDGVLAVNEGDRIVPSSPGSPPGMIEDVLLLDYDSEAALQRLQAEADTLAAVLVEPVHSRRPGRQPQTFLRRLRRLTREQGICLIFDEMVNGFRIAPGGSQEYFGVRADIALYGKVIGGGLPVGVIAGRKDYLDLIDGGFPGQSKLLQPEETIVFGGTFCRHPLSMEAVAAVSGHLLEHGATLCADANALTGALADTLNLWFQDNEVPLRLMHYGAQFIFESYGAFSAFAQPVELPLFYLLLMARGIYTWERRTCGLSTAHTAEDTARIAAAVRESVLALRAGGFPFRLASGAPAGFVPMTPAQENLYAIFLRQHGQDAYHLPLAFRLEGEVDAEALEIALGEIIRRHEALRTAFVHLDGRSLQKIVAEPRFFLEKTDASTEQAIETQLASFIRPFDLAAAPLLRARLARQSDGGSLFMLDILHIAADGASLGIILDELNALTWGKALAAPVPFREVSGGAPAQTQADDAAWWAEKLKNLPRLEWPCDFPANAGQPTGGQVWMRIDAQILEQARLACKDYGITLNMFLNGVHVLLVAALTRSRTICSGMADGGRFTKAAEQAVGMFVNTVPQLFRVDPDASLRAFFDGVRLACSDSMRHRHAPYKSLVDALGFSPAATMCSYERADHRNLQWPGVRATPLAAHGQGAMYDFSIDIVEMGGALNCNLMYSDAFRRATALSFGEVFVWLVQAAAQNREAKVGALPLIPPAQFERLRAEWAGTARPLEPNRGVLDCVLERAAQVPDKTALILDHAPYHERVSYAELVAHSQALAQALIARGVQTGDVVGVLLPRRPAYVIAMLGIWRAGAVLLPLAADQPDERLAFMLEDSRAVALITDAASRPRAAAALAARATSTSSTPCLDVDELCAAAPRDAPAPRSPAPGDLAYILYTSGTTGQPKGVLVEHHSLYNMCRWYVRYYAIAPADRCTAFAPFVFDPSLWEIFPVLMQGAELHIFHEDIRHDLPGMHAYLRRHRVTVTYFLSQVSELIDGTDLPDLRLLVSGGDVLHIARPRGRYRHSNAYGPTEFTITSHVFDLDGASPVPTGKPVDNTQSLIVDETGRLMPDGFPGEMCLAGEQIARGYMNRPELDAHVFVPNPMLADAPAGGTDYRRVYRTGDLFRRLPGGNYLFMGRLDGQVKIRGFRVETDEISNHAMRHPLVKQAIAVALEDDDKQKFLCLYVIPARPTDSGALETELRAALGKALPPYMLPAYYLFLNALPQLGSGKVDLAALPRPEKKSVAAAPPQGAAEEALAQVWREHLRVPRVSREDNFFELGGDSIKALMLTASIRALGFNLEARDIFNAPVLRELAERLTPLAAGAAQPTKSAWPERAAGAASVAEQHQLPADETGQTSADETALRARYGAQLLHLADPTPMQLGMLFQQRLGEDAEMYVEQTALRIEGALDADALRHRFFALVERHESLRGVLVDAGLTRPRLLALAPGAVSDSAFAFHDWREEAADKDARLFDEAARERAAVSDPSRLPLARLCLYRLNDSEYRLIFTVHHVFFDGWSTGIFFSELFAPALPAEPAPPFRVYADYLRTRDAEAARDWWRHDLAGVDERTVIPGLAENTSAARDDAQLPLLLPAALRQNLRALARATRATLNHVLQAAWALVLARANRRDEALFGEAVSVRPHALAGVAHIVGLCTNTLPVRARCLPEQSFIQLVEALRDRALDAAEHAWLPLPEIQAQSALRCDLFTHFFVLENYPAPRGRDDLRIAIVDSFSRTGFAFALSWEADEDGINGAFIYDRARLPDWQAESLRDAYRTVLDAVCASPEQPLSSFALLSPSAQRQLLRVTAPIEAPLDAALDIVPLFRAQAAAQGTHTALVCNDVRLSYAELDRQSDALAAKLLACRAKADKETSRSSNSPAVAAILLERGTGFALSCLAALKAGVAFLPLDTETPDERLAFYLADARPFALLSQAAFASRAPRGLPFLDVDSARETRPDAESVAPLTEIDPESPAYLIYTSGTTGTPKGVLISRRALANQARWSRRQYRIGPNSKITHFAAHAFDVSIWESLPCLSGGGQLHVLTDALRHNPAKLHAYVVTEGITDLWLPPRLATSMLEQYPLDTLASLTAGGDVFAPDAVREENRRLRLFNNYGPTEATITATSHGFYPGEPVTIGKPVDNTPCYILDAHGHPQPLGFTGELCVGGPQVAIGYLGHDELNREKFIPDTFGSDSHGRLYKTGDLCRLLPGGEIDFLGREDSQLKIRGYRLEAGEVERALLRHPGLSACAVGARPDRNGHPRLLAWGVVTPREKNTASAQDILDEAARWLPAYMVPTRLIPVDALPLTVNGKIDFAALPEPPAEIASTAVLDAADETSGERLLIRMLREVLARDDVHAESDFFDLGGDSIRAMMLIAALDRHGCSLELKEVFRARTARALARLLRAVTPSPAAPTAPAAPIPEADERFIRKRYAREGVERILPLTPMQAGMLFDMRHNGDDDRDALYFIENRADIQGELDPDALENRFHQLVSRHEALRLVIAADGVATPCQVVLRHKPGDFRAIDLGALTPEAQQSRIAADCTASRRAAPRPDSDPLLRVLLFRLGPSAFHMALQWQHIVIDGWSLGILLQELFAAELPLSPAPGFSRHIERLQLQDQRQNPDAWRVALDGANDAPRFVPADVPANAEGGGAQIAYSSMLDRCTHTRLTNFARARGLTHNAVLMTVWGLLLARYNDREDLVFAALSSGRSGQQETQLVGPCIAVLPIRLRCPPHSAFADLAAATQDALLDALARDACSGADIRRLVGADFGRSLFVMENQPPLECRAGLAVTPQASFGMNGVELALECLEGERLRLNFHYVPGLYRAAQIERLAEHFRLLLEAALAAPEAPSGDLPLLSPAEELRLLEHCNATARDWPDTTFTELFLQAASSHPEATALRFGGIAHSYAALRASALTLAARLRHAGLPAGAAVGILLPRSADYVIAELGVMLAGAAFVPLDADHPAHRLAGMLENCHAFGVITDAPGAAHPLFGGDHPPTAFQMNALTAAPDEDSPPPVAADSFPDALAYILYTSGSTGAPKGVAIAQKSLANLCRWFAEENQTGVEDVFSLYAPFIFDASIYEAFPALGCGAAVAVAPPEIRTESEELAEFFRAERVSVAFLPPMVGKPLLAAHTFPRLRVVTLAGDSPGALRKMPFKLMNCYGPTEFSVCATFWPVTEDAETPPIGQPVANARCYVLDSRRRLVPFGVAGELYLSGIQLAQGYVGLAEKTAQCFIANPFAGKGEANFARMYKTGDLCRRLPDGNLVFLGRLDRQIKIRGQRFEPGEIEQTLRAHPAVAEAAAVIVQQGAAKLPRVGVTLTSSAAVTEKALMDWLAERLPAWMLPAGLEILPALPLTVNGKIDRAALAAQIAAAPPPRNAPPPQTSALNGETALLRGIWTDVLALDANAPVDDEASFFALGGDSIKAMQMVTRLRAQGLRMTTRQIFRLQSLRRVAAELEPLTTSAVTLSPASVPVHVPVAAAAAHPALAEITARYAALGKHVEQVLPATPMQEGLLAAHRLHPDQPHYLEQMSFTLGGHVDGAALGQRLIEIAARRQALRTVFALRGAAAPLQVVLAEPALAFAHHNLSALSQPARDRHLAQDLRRAREAGLDLEQGPLFALDIYTLDDNRHAIQVSFHHAILDGWSMNLILRDLFAPAPLPTAAADFTDYARWLATADRQAAARWWNEALREAAPSVLPFAGNPADAPRPRNHDHVFDAALTRALRALAERAGVTMSSLLQSAWGLLLARLCDQDETVFGVVLSGRAAPIAGVEEIVGMLAQTVPARIRCDDARTVLDLLKATQDNAFALEEHAVLPLAEILKSTPHGAALLQSLFVFENLPDHAPAASRQLSLDAGFNQTPYALALVADYRAADDALSVRLQHDENAISAALAADLSARLESVLDAMQRAPTAAIGDLSILRAGETETILRAGMAAPPPPSTSAAPVTETERTVVDLFRQAAACAPETVALTDHQRAWTYAEADAAAAALAARLRGLGVGRGAVVAICLQRSARHIPALLGILRAGAAWLTVDTELPAARQAFLLDDSGAAALIVDARADAPDFAGPTLTAPDCFDAPDTVDTDAAFSPPQPEDLACLTYTSGSTGVPKGVLTTHAALYNFTCWHRDFYEVTANDRAGHVFSFAFDASFWGIFPLLAVGGGIHVLTGEARVNPSRTRDEFDLNGITLANIPALFMAEFHRLPAPATLRILTSGGDVQHAGAPRPYRVFNEYGPTEATVMCTCYPVRESTGTLPIGRAVAGAWCMVLDKKGRLQPFGVPGELHIAGPGLARGYWRRDAETAAAFIANAHAPLLPETSRNPIYWRRYRSGDLCRMRPDGTLDFLGRRDTQLSVRGHRVEAAEVEAHLLALPGARAAVAAVGADRRLIAYIVPETAAETAEAEAETIVQWQSALAAALPAYMRPDVIVTLAAIPLTGNGKVDYQALPPPDSAPTARGEGAPARRALELALADVWRTVLEVPAVRLDDDFFALGGDSIKAVRLVAAAESLLGVRFSVTDFLRAHTLRALLAQYHEARRDASSPLIPLRRGTGTALVLVPSLGGSLLCYKPLLDALPADLPIYALAPLGIDDDADDDAPLPARLPEDLPAMTQPYIAPLAASFPQGDFVLLGLCMAGLSAWEIARQLEAQGIVARAVVALNTRSRLLVDDAGKALDDEARQALLADGIPAQAVEVVLSTLGRYEGCTEENPALSPSLAAYLRAQLLAWGGYLPQAGRAAMICIRPLEAAYADYLPFETRPLGWSALAQGGARDIYVSGSHFSMLQAPRVSEIANALLPLLRAPVTATVIPLTPIQRWFFDLPMRHAHFFQSVTLAPRQPRPAAQYQQALRALAERHEMLRAVFLPDPSGRAPCIQTLAQNRGASAFFGLQFCAAAHLEQARRSIAANLDPQRPPLAWCVVGEEETAAGTIQHVVFMLHHLIVDGVSWRVLLQDFAAALNALDAGQPIALAGESGSFAAWASRLADYANSPELAGERDFWRGLPVIAPLLEDAGRVKRLKRELESRELELDRPTSQRVVRQSRAARVGLDAVLLAAFLHSLRDTLGKDGCTVLLEGHGREELFGEVSPVGTLGWFTTMYPLPLAVGDTFAATLRAVRQRLASPPNKGLGYGLLRYLAAARQDEHADTLAIPADLTFNFLGEATLGAPDAAALPFTLESLGSPLDVGDDFPQDTPLALTAHIQDEQFHLTLDWHPAEFAPSLIEALLQGMIAALEHAELGNI